MVLMSASDRLMSDEELRAIGDLVSTLPVFKGFDPEGLVATTRECAEIMGGEHGLDKVIKVIADSVPENLRETAYALAVEIAAVDGKVEQEELRILELLRFALPLDKLPAAAIERAARARHATL
jgi:tellurite resistance protein